MPRKSNFSNRPPKEPRPFFPEKKTVTQLQATLESTRGELKKIYSRFASTEDQLEPFLLESFNGALSPERTIQKDRLLKERNRLYQIRNRLKVTERDLERWIREAKIRQLMLPRR